jgi:hypothetical protein
MKTELPSLITPDATSGLALAGRLADQLHNQFARANERVEHPGGTNYLLAAPVPIEVISSVLFYAITAANHGWQSKGLVP